MCFLDITIKYLHQISGRKECKYEINSYQWFKTNLFYSGNPASLQCSLEWSSFKTEFLEFPGLQILIRLLEGKGAGTKTKIGFTRQNWVFWWRKAGGLRPRSQFNNMVPYTYNPWLLNMNQLENSGQSFWKYVPKPPSMSLLSPWNTFCPWIISCLKKTTLSSAPLHTSLPCV